MTGRRTHIRIPFGRYVTPIGNEFASVEALGALALLGAAVAALVWANAFAGSYARLWHHEVALGVDGYDIGIDLRHWVNEGLMAVFFFVVGLEIKRELVEGELRDRRAAAVPVVAALGGMVLPALLYFAWNVGGPGAKGWGIPMATDLAFALGVLALLGSRISPGLKLFLLVLAIVDDVGAILVIAIFYSGGVEWGWLGAAAGILAVVLLLRRLPLGHPVVYVVPAIALWVCTFESGLHATIAGVVLGLATPAGPIRGRRVIDRLEHRLHPWTSFVVVPLFALANAGVGLGRDALGEAFSSRVTWGVITGLVVGKTVGVAGTAGLMVRLRAGRLPAGVTPRQLLGAGVLAGIGFTVSLFVADLSFAGARLAAAKIGILTASLVAGAVGTSMLASGTRTIGHRRMRIALVDDLMDRSRLSAAVGGVRFARSVEDCAGADVIAVDLARHGDAVAALRRVAPTARIVAFGPHVDTEAAERARAAGADEVLPRSRFFRDPGACLGGSERR